MHPIDYPPSGLSQILAASGLSGDALLGSEIGFCQPFQIRPTWRTKLTTKKRLEREKNGLHAVNSGPLVLRVGWNLASPRVREIAYLENVQTDSATGQINIGVIARRIKLDRRSGVRVVRGEGDGNLEA